MKKIFKQCCVWILTAVCCMGCMPMSAFAQGAGASKSSNAGSGISGTTELYGTTGYRFEFDFNALTQGDNTLYSEQIAEAASLIAADEYHPGEIDLKKSLLPDDDSVLKQLGFKNLERLHLKQSDYEKDQEDTLAFTMGRREIKNNGKTDIVYVLSLRGSVDSWELQANKDDGAWTQDYTDLTGEHPEWTESQQNIQKSTAIATNRVMSHLTPYLEKFAADDANRSKTILITGHSRGAGVANLIGKYFEDDSSLKSFTYTFATPGVAVMETAEAQRYKTIYNILNADDFIVYNPIVCKGFRRYGTDIAVSIADNADLVQKWSNDGFGKMLVGFCPGYLEEMTGLNQTILRVLLNLPIFDDLLSYESAKGPEKSEAKSTAADCDRETYYAKKDLVWVPQDIDDRYKLYYEDAPASGAEETEEYRQFVEDHPDYKRVRIRPCMVDFCESNVISELLSEAEKSGGIVKIANLLEDFNAYSQSGSSDDLSNLLDVLQDFPDAKVLCSIYTIRQNDAIEAGQRYLTAFETMGKSSGPLAILIDHMPTTYYFLTHQYNSSIHSDIRKEQHHTVNPGHQSHPTYNKPIQAKFAVKTAFIKSFVKKIVNRFWKLVQFIF